MSEPGPSAAESSTDMFPALYLYPREDSFDIPKHLSLAGGQRIRIGRQTNNKTVPTQRNSFFKSKVVARKHAEIWEQHGKVSVCSLSPSYIIRAYRIHIFRFIPHTRSMTLVRSDLHQGYQKSKRHFPQLRTAQQHGTGV
jgi:hypothetical protein